MLLRSLHVGQPEILHGPAGPFRTAIRKLPVEGEVHLGPLGLAGDAVADTRVHGGPNQAVLAFGGANYPAWRAELGALEALAPGGFGENLLVEPGDEDTVAVGDIWAIGPVRLEVSMPRMPCATLAQRMGVRDMVRRAARSGRTGWYLRVLESGHLAAGLPVEVLDRPTPTWTIRRSLAVMLDAHAPPTDARGLAGCPALPAPWRERLLARGPAD